MRRAWWHLAAVAATLSLLGLGTLGYVVWNHYPTLPARLAFFWALIMSAAGLSVLPLAVLHRRFRGQLPPAPVLWRESLMVGGFFGLWAWLQLDRLASPWVLMALGLALVLVEAVWLLWGSPRD